MKLYICNVFVLFFAAIPSINHAMDTQSKEITLPRVPTPLIKYISREAFWDCTSLAVFKRTLNALTLLNKNFLQLFQRIKEILNNKNIDAATKYKTFLFHIGFKNQDIFIIAAQIGHYELFIHYFNFKTSPLRTGDNADAYKSLREILESVRDHKGNTVAHIAAKNNHQELWDYLLRLHDDCSIDLQGSRILYSDICWAKQNSIRSLLNQSNKYVNGLNNHAGHQPIDYAYISFGQEASRLEKGLLFYVIKKIINLYICHGSPLFVAVACKVHSEIIKDLIDQGADLNATYQCDKKNVVDLLQFCVLKKNKEAFIYLSTHDCNLEKKYEHNESLLFWIGQLIAYDLYEDNLNFFDFIYEKLATTLNDQSTQDGQTLLHRAVNGSNKQFIEKLIELKASCTLQDTKGNTPLHLGLIRKDLPSNEESCMLAQSLMNQEAILTQNNEGNTPCDLIINRLKKITSRQKTEQALLEKLLQHIKENYVITYKDNDSDNNSITGDEHFQPVQENQNPTLFQTLEKKISSLFEQFGNLLDTYFDKK